MSSTVPPYQDMLGDFLLQQMDEHNSMPLDIAHGYLTAVVSGPELILPDVWMPRVLGESEFTDAEQAQRISGALMNVYNDCIDDLQNGCYAPIILHLEEGYENDPLPLPFGWCEGYAIGWGEHGQSALDRMMDDAECGDAVSRLTVFLMYSKEQMLHPPDEQAHREMVAGMGDAASVVYHWWLERRAAPTSMPEPVHN